MTTYEIKECMMPCAILLDGPFAGRLVPIEGPYEVHTEEGVEYHVVPRGDKDWWFPVEYRIAHATG